jgi:carbamoyl-phosphate synthase small subunit
LRQDILSNISMEQNPTNQAVLLLEDGSFYTGKAAGKPGTTFGEVCINTGMTGYQEVFTDPSYYKQVLLTTNVHVGNYGITHADMQSDKVYMSGLICKSFTDEYSRKMADDSLQHFLESQNILCIHDVDTRSIVRNLRKKGAMKCIISTETLDKESLQKQLAKTPPIAGIELASEVSNKPFYTLGNADASLRLAILDFGMKEDMIRTFVSMGCYVGVFPAMSKAKELIDFAPDGYFLSNGPGDPGVMGYAIEVVQELITSGKPLFGICMGHQILALANGISTYKMKNGHRGVNHPVINLITGRSEVTSQNHGFAVSEQDIADKSETIEVTHRNLNDQTVEGIRLKGKPVFSVQYHPEANPGPNDSRYLFDEFIALLKQSKYN